MLSTATVSLLTSVATSTVAVPLLPPRHPTLGTTVPPRTHRGSASCRPWSRMWRLSKGQAAQGAARIWPVLDGSRRPMHHLPHTARRATGIPILIPRLAMLAALLEPCSMPVLPRPSKPISRVTQHPLTTQSRRARPSCGQRNRSRTLFLLDSTMVLILTKPTTPWWCHQFILHVSRPKRLMWFTSYGGQSWRADGGDESITRKGKKLSPADIPAFCFLVSWHHRIKENLHYECYNNS